jgi:hypothetical protein
LGLRSSVAIKEAQKRSFLITVPEFVLAIVKVAKPVKAVLQLLSSDVLFFGYGLARRPTTPAKMRSDIGIPTRSSEATAKPIVGFGLNLRNASIDFATGALTLYIAPTIIPIEAKFKSASVVDVKRFRPCRRGRKS